MPPLKKSILRFSLFLIINSIVPIIRTNMNMLMKDANVRIVAMKSSLASSIAVGFASVAKLNKNPVELQLAEASQNSVMLKLYVWDAFRLEKISIGLTKKVVFAKVPKLV